MKKTIKLTESEFREMVYATVNEALEDEGLRNMWNGFKTGYKTFNSKDNSELGIRDRFQRAKSNYKLQGQYDDMNSLVQQLSKFIDAGKIDPNTTIAQLIGGKYNGNKFGRMTGKMNNRMSQMAKNGLNNHPKQPQQVPQQS